MTEIGRFSLVQTIYRPQIVRAAEEFGDHEGVGIPKITRWMVQFEDDDLPLAEKILDEITYYSSSKIRSMVRRLVESIYHKFDEFTTDKILFIPIGYSFEGSSIVARALRDVIGERFIKHMSDLERLERGTYDALVFLDDFSGTGSTLVSWWVNVESIVEPRGVPFILALLVLNSRARPPIEEFTDVLCVDELDEEYNVVSLNSSKFSEDEKQRLFHYCKSIGCRPEYQLGFGECGLLVAFKHGCPDNSLPILWHTNEDWESLFKRSGI